MATLSQALAEMDFGRVVCRDSDPALHFYLRRRDIERAGPPYPDTLPSETSGYVYKLITSWPSPQAGAQDWRGYP